MSHLKGLAADVDKALRQLESALEMEACDLLGDFIDPGSDEFDPDDSEITPDGEVIFQLPRCDDGGIDLTYGDLQTFANEVANAELRDNVECWTPHRVLVRVEHVGHNDSYRKLEALIEKESLHSIKVGECKYEMYLDTETTVFGFMVFKSGNWEKYFPPASSEDLFVVVQWSGTPDNQTARRLIDGLIFELASSFEVFLRRAPRPILDLDYYDDKGTPPPIRDLRPPLYGAGLSEALALYSLAIATDDPEFQIIGFVKVLEHISATVVREDLAAAVRAKLLSSRALDPDAEFILELESEINNHTRQHRKDSDALRLTVQKCCDATELGKRAPAYLDLSRVEATTTGKVKESALKQFASSVSATRNEIVHAKLNYEKTGEECPKGHIRSLADTCRVAAEQAVRWFALQHENVRVIRNHR